MAKSRREVFDPEATLTQAEEFVQAGDLDQAHPLLKAYRCWRLKGNTAPLGGDERYGDLVDRSSPKFTFLLADAGEASSGHPPATPGNALSALARLLLSLVDHKQRSTRAWNWTLWRMALPVANHLLCWG